MYTWGYLKDAILAKLDLDETEASVQNLINRFPIYANEAMTQICSTIKPKKMFATFEVEVGAENSIFTMPDDFIGFNDDVPIGTYADEFHDTHAEGEIHSDVFCYVGYNQVRFFYPGRYVIPYDARWITFTKNIPDQAKLQVPDDILDCIPSYVVSQCYKIDDEYKSSVFRNEYEMFLARINDTDYRNTRTIKIKGGW